GRAETEALLNGLPQQPLLRTEYRGITLEEMDLDALLKAAPSLVLVDELVNVQHLESLNDQVRGITGVQVRETLPDWVLQEAFDLVLIDLP
ncbi:sensor protein KdpD, partial [Pseudomonas syringae pv. actinidiae ICMP 19079]